MRLKEDTPKLRRAISEETNMIVFSYPGDNPQDKFRACSRATGFSVEELKRLSAGVIPTREKRTKFEELIGKPGFIEDMSEEVSTPSKKEEQLLDIDSIAELIYGMDKKSLAILLQLIALRLED